MADPKTQTQQQPENPRVKLREERQRRMRVIAGSMGQTVKVWPADESMRMHLRHGNVRFRASLDQSVEWPNDSFTKRRIADGSVRTDGPSPGGHEATEPDDSHNAREQAVARAGIGAIADQANKTLRLTSLSPNSAVSGSADLVMTCNGTGFTAETVIKFGDYDEPTTLVSPTKVTTGVKPSLFAPAVVPVLVHNGAVSSEPLDFTFTAAAGAQAAKVQPPKPTAPQSHAR